MNLGQWIAAKFGAQYVMLRCGHQLTFRVNRAYCIGGRWYTRTLQKKARDCPSGGEVLPAGHAYWMLTNATRLTSAESADFDPSTMHVSHELWLPLTDKVDAGVSMYD